MTLVSTAVRATHLVTNAAWFGGSLMGVVGLDAAARCAGGTRTQTEVTDAGWQAWGPVQGGAIALHLLSGLGIVADNRRRTLTHPPTTAAVVAKTALTGVALAATLGAARTGQALGDLRARSEDAAQPASALEGRLRQLQWAVPASTAGLLVLDAYLGEQQRGPAGLLDWVRRR